MLESKKWEWKKFFMRHWLGNITRDICTQKYSPCIFASFMIIRLNVFARKCHNLSWKTLLVSARMTWDPQYLPQTESGDISIVFVTFSIPGSDYWLSTVISVWHCCILTALRRSILKFYWFIRNQEICLMSSQIVTPGPSVTSHLASDTGGGQRMSPASPGVPWPRSESPEAAQCLGSRSGEIGSVPVQTPWSQSQSWDH